jgi:hypothetical protein
MIDDIYECNVFQSYLLLDPYMCWEVDRLFSHLRKRSMIQYVTSFESLSVETCSRLYNMSLIDMEKELAMLIEKKEIPMRLDGHSKVRTIILLERITFLMATLEKGFKKRYLI